ncbi:hypothetical protein TIFTF001_025262 [Ficus carica]|uniref:Uncharacterized protein n=1 Tax=Ficus carica TaxID=3494 RepID=A0AA88AMP2_FICCA|nr:hypothetical protein TIFTF001_025262 [Ficus carica]
MRATEATQALIPSPLPLIESSHEPSNVLEQPLAKKQKAGEKQTKKVAGKRKREQSREVLFMDTDMDLVSEGRIQDHLDELSWDAAKCILMGMGLTAQLKGRLSEERKSESSRSTIGNTLNRMAKEGAEMIKSMVDSLKNTKAENDALKESIKLKDEDITGLVACVVGEYEKAFLKGSLLAFEGV